MARPAINPHRGGIAAPDARAPQPGDRCILDVWAAGVGRDKSCAGALGYLLLCHPELAALHDLAAIADWLIGQISRQDRQGPTAGLWFAATALVLGASGQEAEAAELCADAMPLLIVACSDAFGLLLVQGLFKKFASGDERFAPLGSACRISGDEGADLLHLRGMALVAFTSGRAAEAERIYRHLVMRNFEPGGSRCHLARVLIFVTGHDEEAATLLREAWSHRGHEPLYVRARILFLQALLAILGGGDAQPFLAPIKAVIAQPAVRSDWTMGLVMERIGHRLGVEQRELFTALLGVLGATHGPAQLEALPAWQHIIAGEAGGIGHA